MVKKNQDELQLLPETGYMVTYEQLNTLLEFLRLWSQLAMWTRSLVISTVGNLGNVTAIANHLYSIPAEFFRVFRIFYGPTLAQQLTNLLTEFITSQWRLIEAMQAGDQQVVDELTIKLYQTADDFAEFFAKLNIYWDEDQWKSLLYQYIRLVIEDMIAAMSEDHAREIEVYRRLEDVAELIGSYMARGIIARSFALENTNPPPQQENL